MFLAAFLCQRKGSSCCQLCCYFPVRPEVTSPLSQFGNFKILFLTTEQDCEHGSFPHSVGPTDHVWDTHPGPRRAPTGLPGASTCSSAAVQGQRGG